MCVCNISYVLINTCMVIYKMDFIMLFICYYLYVCKTKLYKYLIMKYSISLRCSIVMLSNEIHVKTLYNFSRRLLVETFYNVFYKVFALRYIYILTLFMQNFWYLLVFIYVFSMFIQKRNKRSDTYIILCWD